MPGSNLVVDFPLYGESMSAKSFDIIFEVSKLNLVACSTENSENSDDRSIRKSLNITEYVPVPSSEHVAEIVGRQGCKIKALRGKTNTYIKTPVRGEDPVFVITGRKEDVHNAKMEIISAAEHFSQIRACRKQNNANPVNPSTTPGQVTIQVRVPYRVVGLVVGPKGATIKRIQQQTRTYIVTPSRDKEPVFEITGTAEQVDLARKEIELHIQNRTGGLEGISDSETDAKPNYDQASEYVSQNGTHEETNGVFESSHINKGCELDEGIDSPTIDTYNGWWSQSDLTDPSKTKNTTLCSQNNEAPQILSNRSHSVSSADLLSKYCAPNDDCLLRPQVRRMYSDPVVAFPLNVEYATSDFFFPCLNSCTIGARYGELTASPSESFGSVSSSQENVLTLQDTVHW